MKKLIIFLTSLSLILILLAPIYAGALANAGISDTQSTKSGEINTSENQSEPGKINTGAFIESLPVMGKGMLGIFIVVVTIIAVVYLLNFTTKKRNKTEKN